MALSRTLIVVALTATIFSTMVVAKDFIVGDESGWITGVDYQAWAANKVFHLGDTFTFNYNAWKDNVIRVNGSDFISCSIPPKAPLLTSGHDTVVLTTYGRRWYISGAANHCKNGQKLVITVLPPHGAWSATPSVSPSPSVSLSPLAWSPEAPSPSAPWSSDVPHFSRSQITKKLNKFFQRKLIAV